MTDDRWERIERLFEGALDQPEPSRSAWLDAASGGDAALREEVLGLLEAHRRTGGILERGLPPLVYDVADHLRRALGDRYTIERELGYGGSAIVFLAHEQKHGRRVVLKVLKPEVAGALGPERFLREVQIAARLAHPHILGLIDSGNAEGLLFYVMPFVEGRTLRDRLRAGPVEVNDAIILLRDVADALAYAHRAGVVHRDLKPENVLCVGEHAFLMDFGIAKVLEGSHGFQHVTEPGMSIGTPAYMAPEQAAGDPSTDQRADIYAWGLLGREMLTGREPRGFAVHRADPIFSTPLGYAQRGVPAGLGELIDACLTADPTHRVRSMDDVRAALDGLAQSGPGAALPLRRRAGARAWLVAAGIVGLLAAAFALVPRATADLPVPVAVAALTNETGDSSLTTWGRLAGDWITQGLQETGRVPVVPWPASAQASLAIAAETERGNGDLVRRMREETRAGTVVTGAYYLVGDSLRFQVEVSNALTGVLLGALPPITVPRSAAEAGVRELRARLMGQMAVWSDERISAIPGIAQRPPTFEAYRLFDHGLQLYNGQEYRRAAEEFHRAHQLDTAFVVALVYETICQWNAGRPATVDSLLAELGKRRSVLSDYHAVQVRILEALMEGDRGRALAAARRAVEVAAGSKGEYNRAQIALELNRPREARAALESLDPDRGDLRGWSSYWTALAHANHLLGDHARELQAARGMRTRHPDRRVAIVLEARALAAAGRVRELDSVLGATIALPARTYWSQAAALVVAGEEFLAHHDSTLAHEYLERARAWLADRHAADPAYAAWREWLAGALYGLRRWSEAATVLAPVARDTSQRYQMRAMAVLAGYRALGGPPPGLPEGNPRDAGERTFFAGRLALIGGDTTRGIELLSEALRLGVDGFPWLHGSAYHDLRPAAGDPRFQQLMAGDRLP